jgi:hypothetical protein
MGEEWNRSRDLVFKERLSSTLEEEYLGLPRSALSKTIKLGRVECCGRTPAHGLLFPAHFYSSVYGQFELVKVKSKSEYNILYFVKSIYLWSLMVRFRRDRLWGPPSHYSMGIGGFIPGRKAGGA